MEFKGTKDLLVDFLSNHLRNKRYIAESVVDDYIRNNKEKIKEFIKN